MVRIGKYVLFERESKLREKFKATVDMGIGTARKERKTFNVGEHSWRDRCQHFDKLAHDYPLFNQSCLALAGITTSQGVFYQAAVNKQDETYALAEEALWRVEKLKNAWRVNGKMYETVLRMAKYGGAFWEATFTPSFGFRLPPYQEGIEPAEANELGEITRWRQTVNGQTTAEWRVEPQTTDSFIVPIMWNVTTDTWPYGTGIGVGSETELEALIKMESNAKDYMDKQAWPYEILQLGDGKADTATVLDADYTSAKTAWKNRQPGQGIATRNMPVNIIPGGTGSAPIRDLATLCQLMKDNLHDGLMIAPISKLYNSTEASARELKGHIMTVLGQPIQWILKEHYEEFILKPFLWETARISSKGCPQVLFESPDEHKKEEGEFYVGLVNAKIQTPQQACEHLGLEYDEEYWQEEEEKRQEQFQMKQKQKEEEQGSGAEEEKPKEEEPQKVGESWIVTKLNRNSPDSRVASKNSS